MAASCAYQPASASKLTESELAELKTELQQELLRLELAPTGSARRLDVRTQSRAQLITDALKRIRAGVYGACQICRSPIPYERLAVIPETKTCVRCG